MAERKARASKRTKDGQPHKPQTVEHSRSAAIANRGIRNGGDFAEMMSALIGDIAMSRIDPRAANAICNAGGKLLKVVEMQHKYGTPKHDKDAPRTLQLVPRRAIAE